MIDEVVDYDDADAEGRCGLRMVRFGTLAKFLHISMR